MNDDNILCGICNQTKLWHQEHKPKHRFVAPGEDPQIQRAEDPPRKLGEEPGQINPLGPPPTFGFTSDPVLRMVLIEAGVITTDQLDEAEHRLKSISGGGVVFARPSMT